MVSCELILHENALSGYVKILLCRCFDIISRRGELELSPLREEAAGENDR